MENSTFILVPSAGGQQLQIPVAISSAGAIKPNSSHTVVVSSANSAHGQNLTVGKSVLNVRTIGPNFVNSWKPAESVERPTNAQTHPLHFIVANPKDGFVNVPADLSSLTSRGGARVTVANSNVAAAANSGRVALVKHPSGGVAGVVQKIAPAATATNFMAPVANGSLRAMAPGGNKMPGRTAAIAASFAGNAGAIVPKTVTGATGAPLWASLSVASSTVTGNPTTSTSPSKQLIIQLAPEQLSFLAGSVAPAAGSNSSRVSNSASAAPVSYFTPASHNHNNNNTDGAAQYVRVVTSNATIQPKLVLGSHLIATGAHGVSNNAKIAVSSAQTARTASSSSHQHTQPVTTQRLILPAAPQVRPSIAPSNVFKIETQMATAGTAVVGQPVAFIGQPGFAFQPSNSTVQRSRLSLDGSLPTTHNESLSHSQTNRLRSWTPEAPTRPRKPCNCNKSQCLKLYCECFANGEFCTDCNCCNCFNNLQHEEERSRAVKACLDRNPHAFHPKIGKGGSIRQHCKGCNCKRSGCLKNYCECYEAKIPCSRLCRCVGCKNFEESPDRQNLLHLANAAEVRVQQQAAAETKLASQIVGPPVRPAPPPSGAERPAYSFLTLDVIEAMCSCLIAEAEDGEQSRRSDASQEQRIITEFGRCLTQVIDSASRTRAPTPMDQ